MNVNVVVCCNQSPYSAGCSLSLHREPSCTHTSAQVDLSEYLQGFQFHYFLMLPCFVEQELFCSYNFLVVNGKQGSSLIGFLLLYRATNCPRYSSVLIILSPRGSSPTGVLRPCLNLGLWMAVLNSVGFLTKVRSMAKYSAEDSVLQAIRGKLYILQSIYHVECRIVSLAWQPLKSSLYICISLYFLHFFISSIASQKSMGALFLESCQQKYMFLVQMLQQCCRNIQNSQCSTVACF